MPSAPPINTTLDKDFTPLYEDLERHNYQTSESKLSTKKAEPETDKMAPKQTRAMTTKEKELESAITPLMKQLENIKKAKVLETSWA